MPETEATKFGYNFPGNVGKKREPKSMGWVGWMMKYYEFWDFS